MHGAGTIRGRGLFRSMQASELMWEQFEGGKYSRKYGSSRKIICEFMNLIKSLLWLQRLLHNMYVIGTLNEYCFWLRVL